MSRAQRQRGCSSPRFKSCLVATGLGVLGFNYEYLQAAHMVDVVPVAKAMLDWDGAGDRKAEESNEAEPVDLKRLVKTELVPLQASVSPGGVLEFALTFDVANEWHIYWPGLNDTGFPPSLKWTLPEGWSVKSVRWPVPKRQINPGMILDHVYEGRTTLLVKIAVSKDVVAPDPINSKQNPAKIGLAVRWLACKESCIPGTSEVEVALPLIHAGTTNLNVESAQKWAAIRSKAEDAMPKALTGNKATELELAVPFRAKLQTSKDAGRTSHALGIEAPGAMRIRFFPGANCSEVKSILEEGDVANDRVEIELSPGQDGSVRAEGIIQIVREISINSGGMASKKEFTESFIYDSLETTNVPKTLK